MTENQRIANLIFGNSVLPTESYEQEYTLRNISDEQRVTRFAPSPTGYLHFGGLFTCFVNSLVAHSSNGIFYLRIEDTDSKREIEGGIKYIIDGLNHFGIIPDEGYTSSDAVKGNYGPYKQSERAHIYHSFAKKLMENGYAYPCFCTEDELSLVRAEQQLNKEKTGYYGKYAKCRELSYEEIKQKLDSGLPYVVRLHSPGSEENKVVFDDMIKGRIEMPENDEDIVILKSDGIPTYHFAHVVDDHLMRTTHIIRGDEWISSVPKHIQMFKLLGFKVPKYAHLSPILKEEDGNKRKLSKRKDPEAAVDYYISQGYPKESVIEYMLTIANSTFEDWRKANKTEDISSFPFNLKKMSVSGALFDINKLNDISKNVISTFSAEKVYNNVLEYARVYDKDLFDLLSKDKEFAVKIFSIDRQNAKPRKDIAKWHEVKDYINYFYDSNFNINLPDNITKENAVNVLSAYKDVYDENDDNQQWFEKIKSICPQINFCPDTKTYKANPELYQGSAGDASTVIRCAVTGRTNSPTLCDIMKVLGKDECINRIDNAIKYLKEV